MLSLHSQFVEKASRASNVISSLAVRRYQSDRTRRNALALLQSVLVTENDQHALEMKDSVISDTESLALIIELELHPTQLACTVGKVIIHHAQLLETASLLMVQQSLARIIRTRRYHHKHIHQINSHSSEAS